MTKLMKTWPRTVFGKTSPKPTVVTVTSINHMACGTEVNVWQNSTPTHSGCAGGYPSQVRQKSLLLLLLLQMSQSQLTP